MRLPRRPFWRRTALAAASAGVLALSTALLSAAAANASPGLGHAPDGLGIQPGKIKHVWLIILENKSYDATFTGLNNNTYLWKTLPAQGVLLKNYYGTGHFSLDNYISHGQRPGHRSPTPRPTAPTTTSSPAAST